MSKKVQDKNKDSILIRSNVDNHIALKAHIVFLNTTGFIIKIFLL